MYENRYHLNSKPFNLAPTVRSYFNAESIQGAIVQAQSCIDRESGPVIVTGSPGTGKSLLLAILERHYSPTHRVVRLQCARLGERNDLLQAILYELGLPYLDMSEGELRLSLIDFLKSDDSHGLLLLVDEAHSLSTGLLDELRLITNFVRDGRHRVSLVMAGSPALEDHLIDTRCESFNQRIGARCYLGSLTQKETFEYVITHIERAGGNGEELFTDQALSSVHEFSDGCPRVINQICDHSLMIAAGVQADRVSAEIVLEAWNQVQSIPGSNIGAIGTNSVSESSSSSPLDMHDTADEVTQHASGSEMIIEFGQLDEEPVPSPSLPSPSLPNPSLPNPSLEQSTAVSSASPAGSESPDRPTVADWESEGPQLQECANDSNPDEPCPFDELNELQADSDSRGGEMAEFDSGQTEPLEEFDNPFEEVFSEEERIDPKFIPVVAEQNISALTLGPDQLNFLSNHNLPTAIAVAADFSGVQMPSFGDVSQNINHDDLKVNQESLPSVEQIEADIVRMQRDICIRDVTADGYHSTCTTDGLTAFVCTDDDADIDEPIRLVVPDDNPVESAAHELPDVAAIAREIVLQDVGGTSEEPMNRSQQSNMAADDRDMMIVEMQGTLSTPCASLDDDPPTVTSTGSAIRMNYEQLFQQLRNDGRKQ